MSAFDFLLPATVVPTDIFRFGVITAIQPLRVRLDGDVAQTEVTPIVINESGGVGSRVLVQIHNRQLFIVGRVGGAVKILGSAENLNDYEYTGFFHQPLSANAASGTNYPAGTAGMLRVERGSNGGQIFQEYTTYTSGNRWFRSRYNGTWNGWKNVVTEDENGKAYVNRLRIVATDDASETSTNQPLQIGPDGGYRVVADTNEWLVFSSGSTYGNFFFNGASLGVQGRTTGSTFGPFLENMEGVSGSRSAGLKQSGGTTYFQVEGMWTTTNAANCYVNTSGTLYRSTSVRAAKLAIEDLSDAKLDALLKVQPRTWFDRRDAEQLALDIENGTEDRTEVGTISRQVGVVAEEIEELGLEEFLLRGDEGQLEGVAYDRFGPAALKLISLQAARIDELEKRLFALEEKA